MTQQEMVDDGAQSNVQHSIVLIRNLVRPFTLSALKDLLAEHGEVVDFWMDNIKSCCIATYATVVEAETTCKALNGVVWPPVTGRALLVATISPEEAEEYKGQSIQPKTKAKTLDELFRKTETKPTLYFLPRSTT